MLTFPHSLSVDLSLDRRLDLAAHDVYSAIADPTRRQVLGILIHRLVFVETCSNSHEFSDRDTCGGYRVPDGE